MTTVHPDLEWLVGQTTIAPNGRTARVGGHDLTAETSQGLVSRISTHLYTEWHAGIVRKDSTPSMPGLTRDLQFEERLTQVTPHTNREVEVRVLETVDRGEGRRNGIVFLHNGIRLYADREFELSASGDRARVRVPSLAPNLTPGFLFYTSRNGTGHANRPLRLYVHLTNGDAAVDAWQRCLTWAEDRGLPFRAKVLSRADSFPRRDALVLYAPTQMWNRLGDLARHLRAPASFASTSSVFATRIEHGVSAAWEPMDARRSAGQTSFGEHRSQAVARSLVANRHLTGEALSSRLAADLMAANIDPAHPHRNLDSPLLLQGCGI
ncbi:T3SS effector HopA1 family protein [Rhodococcus sp. NPDC078407]|uniref:T3SS effector HopA1 family protein n=1 Tax=Rhodococcus sp. NPDC078407 TaxID=3364509 RepID=UPI0037CB966E